LQKQAGVPTFGRMTLALALLLAAAPAWAGVTEKVAALAPAATVLVTDAAGHELVYQGESLMPSSGCDICLVACKTHPGEHGNYYYAEYAAFEQQHDREAEGARDDAQRRRGGKNLNCVMPGHRAVVQPDNEQHAPAHQLIDQRQHGNGDYSGAGVQSTGDAEHPMQHSDVHRCFEGVGGGVVCGLVQRNALMGEREHRTAQPNEHA